MVRWYSICLFFFTFTYYLARICMRDAFEFKKNKKQLKLDKIERTRYYKIFGLYHLTESNAPHHMKKYAVIRVYNVISFILMSITFAFAPPYSEASWIFWVLLSLHIIFLIVPFLFDGILLSNTTEYGKTLDFDQSKKP